MSIVTINIKDADPSFAKFGKREGIIYGKNTSYYADTDAEVLRFIADKIHQASPACSMDQTSPRQKL